MIIGNRKTVGGNEEAGALPGHRVGIEATAVIANIANI